MSSSSGCKYVPDDSWDLAGLCEPGDVLRAAASGDGPAAVGLPAWAAAAQPRVGAKAAPKQVSLVEPALETGCVFVVRRIHRLGPQAREILTAHFSRYGRVSMVLVHQGPHGGPHGHSKSAAASVGFVLMEDAESVRGLLAAGPDQMVAGHKIRVAPFVPSESHWEMLKETARSSGPSISCSTVNMGAPGLTPGAARGCGQMSPACGGMAAGPAAGGPRILKVPTPVAQVGPPVTMQPTPFQEAPQNAHADSTELLNNLAHSLKVLIQIATDLQSNGTNGGQPSSTLAPEAIRAAQLASEGLGAYAPPCVQTSALHGGMPGMGLHAPAMMGVAGAPMVPGAPAMGVPLAPQAYGLPTMVPGMGYPVLPTMPMAAPPMMMTPMAAGVAGGVPGQGVTLVPVAPGCSPGGPRADGARPKQENLGKQAARRGQQQERKLNQKPGGREPATPAESATLGTHLTELQKEDPSCVLIARRIGKIGFESDTILKQHFSKYGVVKLVLVAHSQVKPLKAKSSLPRMRPGCLGFIVMEKPEDVKGILAGGPEEKIAGFRIQVEAFQHRQKPCSATDSTSAGDTACSGSNSNGSENHSVGSENNGSEDASNGSDKGSSNKGRKKEDGSASSDSSCKGGGKGQKNETSDSSDAGSSAGNSDDKRRRAPQVGKTRVAT